MNKSSTSTAGHRNVRQRHDATLFLRAYNLVHAANPDYRAALTLFEKNIRAHPKAGNIDYDYAWATLCLAHLRRFDDVLTYYTIMRTRFYGWQVQGSNGGERNWERLLERVRSILTSSNNPQAKEVLSKIRRLDRQAVQQLREEALTLARAASGGDKTALYTLRGKRYHAIFVKLVESGQIQLDLALEPDPTSNHQDVDQFWVSVVRSDGVLVPFAMYKNRRWSNPWPKPESYRELKAGSLSDIPVSWLGQNGSTLRTWYLWPGQGPDVPTAWYLWALNKAPTLLEILKPVQVETHCQRAWGLVSDLSIGNSASPIQSKIGIALSTNLPIRGMIIVKETDLGRTKVLSLIKPTFDQLERNEIAKSRHRSRPGRKRLRYTGHPTSSRERENVSLSLSKLYRSASPVKGHFIYYFESQKEYNQVDSSAGRSCPAISFFKGWISEDQKAGQVFLSTQFALTNCDMKEVATAVPLGIMIIKGDIFLITEKHYYEGESYSILKLDASGIESAIDVPGGGC